MLEFAWLAMFGLLPLPFLFRWILKESNNNQSRALQTSLYHRWHSFSEQDLNSRVHWLHLFISSIIWIALVTAATRPQWVGEPIELPASGRDLMISIDVSGSMEEHDLTLKGQKTDRLSVVKHILFDFIERRKGDRLGLILFGEHAYLQTPLTFDLKTINQMLVESYIGIAGDSKTAIGDGIGQAVKQLKERPEQNRVLILLTDGRNNTGSLEPIEAAKLAKHAGITIYTIGVGADAMMVKDLFFGTRKVNPSEELDETTLSKVAQITGGRYFRARDENELKQIYAELDKLEPIEKEVEVYRPVSELFYYPLLLAVLVYLLAFFVSLILNNLEKSNKERN